MSTSSFSRRLMVVMIAATVALGGIALPAAAKGGQKGRGDQQVQTVGAKGKGRSAEKRALQRAPKFVVAGRTTAVDATTVTVQIKGGNKSLRKLGTPVAFTVADDARVKLNGERVALSALAAGDRVVVKGAKVGDVLTAYKVFASREEAEDAEDSQDTEDVTSGDDAQGDDAQGDDAQGDDAQGDDAQGDDAQGDDADDQGDDSATSDGDAQ